MVAQGEVPLGLDLGRGADVVEMPVRADQPDQPAAARLDRVQQDAGVVAGIEEQGFARVGGGQQVGVGQQRADGVAGQNPVRAGVHGRPFMENGPAR